MADSSKPGNADHGSPKGAARQFTAPRGTRDFYPQDLAVRRYIEGVWRKVSINHGFDEIDGPTIEHLDLYTHKSGPGIASELFQVFSGKDEEEVKAIRGGKLAPYALRPEFTPTLARMVAAKAGNLPMPIKWFAIPSHFRAERPQRGRLREFMQWNVDFIGDDSPRADAEVIATAITALEKLGLSPQNVQVKTSNRMIVSDILERLHVAPALIDDAVALLDQATKLTPQALSDRAEHLGLGSGFITQFADFASIYEESDVSKGSKRQKIQRLKGLKIGIGVWDELVLRELEDWCDVDFSIVRGLAYYTGTVFEIIAEGERAIAGGGRYDKLIESFGGPSLPACGFGMGDVVLANLLRDKGLLKPDMEYLPRPHAFVIAANDESATKLPGLVAGLRREGFHIRHSYKATRNVGKLLGDASKARALTAIILGEKLKTDVVELKDLGSGEQRDIAIGDLAAALRPLIDRHALDR